MQTAYLVLYVLCSCYAGMYAKCIPCSVRTLFLLCRYVCIMVEMVFFYSNLVLVLRKTLKHSLFLDSKFCFTCLPVCNFVITETCHIEAVHWPRLEIFQQSAEFVKLRIFISHEVSIIIYGSSCNDLGIYIYIYIYIYMALATVREPVPVFIFFQYGKPYRETIFALNIFPYPFFISSHTGIRTRI